MNFVMHGSNHPGRVYVSCVSWAKLQIKHYIHKTGDFAHEVLYRLVVVFICYSVYLLRPMSKTSTEHQCITELVSLPMALLQCPMGKTPLETLEC